jgi:long-chain fatty acid transport protein
MRNPTNGIAITLASLLTAATAAHAGGYAIPTENARELALCQATVAAQTGPEAVFQNVAALAGHDGFAVSASLEMLANQTTWTSPDPAVGQVSTLSHPNFPPEIAVSYGGKTALGLPWGVGAAFLVPGGGSLFWPDEWAGSQQVQTVDQRVYLFQVGGALQPIDMLKLGATFVDYRVTEELTQKINFLPSMGQARLGLAGNAYSFGLGAELTVPGIPLVFGLDYRHKGDLKLSGNLHVDNVPAALAAALQDQVVRSNVTVPNELFLGAAYSVLPDLRVMGSWSLERWVVYTADVFQGDHGFFATVPRHDKNAYVFRVGAEWERVPGLNMGESLTLRLGAQRSVSPQPSGELSPSLSDADSWGLSVGAGYQILAGLRADVAYQIALFDDVTATGSAFPGSYSTIAHLVSAGLTYRFGK